MSKNKIRPIKIPQHESKIKELPVPDTIIKFNFKYIDFTNPKFVITECEKSYFKSLIDRLRNISSWKEIEFRQSNSKSLRSHPIKWSETTEPNGFKNLKGELSDSEGWQFQISSNEHGRVHGFLLHSVFYIVWFDPNHNLYAPK